MLVPVFAIVAAFEWKPMCMGKGVPSIFAGSLDRRGVPSIVAGSFCVVPGADSFCDLPAVRDTKQHTGTLLAKAFCISAVEFMLIIITSFLSCFFLLLILLT